MKASSSGVKREVSVFRGESGFPVFTHVLVGPTEGEVRVSARGLTRFRAAGASRGHTPNMVLSRSLSLHSLPQQKPHKSGVHKPLAPLPSTLVADPGPPLESVFVTPPHLAWRTRLASPCAAGSRPRKLLRCSCSQLSWPSSAGSPVARLTDQREELATRSTLQGRRSPRLPGPVL